MTLANALKYIAARLTATNDAAGEFAFFKYSATKDYFECISDGLAGVTAKDIVIGLVGATQINAIDHSSEELTILS
ncbi:hypothetical protein [Polynucleobacter asymbioticus]|jgi:hypothetical protein|uniref:Uncharacterized protein n=1 Tax=Polynucleobacter asymbioticus TaxID=576611 RepID=A0AAC9IQH0_9BURK|nr:hypothetical protein [Polynucleobacter asymbioticus]APB98180.1 hypothetical protein A4F89_01925 [Polynucleobacter asymbioticus]APC00466.1 hypothetical protein AOC25_01930 [Polynucleobacter asymbioticus]